MIAAIRSYSSTPTGRMCQHCRARWIRHAYFLCGRCWRDAATRSLYEPGAVGPLDVSLIPADPSSPTPALPGSPEKLAVLAARFELSLPLFHTGDAPMLTPAQTEPARRRTA